jgi:alanine racemase
MLYGKAPLPVDFVPFDGFRPVLLSVRSGLIHVGHTAAEKRPGMDGRYMGVVTGPTGVVPFGRRDGNRAALPGHDAFMIVNGAVAPVLAISSEHTVLDLSNVPDPRVGDEVIIIGSSGGHTITLADRARWQNTGLNDILMMMSGRMSRAFRQ